MHKDVHSPYIRTKVTTASIMQDVCVALIPALVGAIIFFGIGSLLITLVSVATCVAGEALWQFAHHQKITVKDFSAVVTGMLLAFNVPSTTPLWVIVLGAAFSILVVKQFFGGIGNNVINPALMGRLFLMLVYPTKIMSYAEPMDVDAITSATMLASLKATGKAGYSLWDAFVGKVPGSLGETSALLLLIGFAYLVWKKEVNVAISGAFFATICIISLCLGQNPFMQLFAGGVVLGGCYMLTDYNLASGSGKWIYGIAAGMIVMAIRLWGIYPEGVCFALLIVNSMSGLIDGLLKKGHIYGIED